MISVTKLRPKFFDLWRDIPADGKTIKVTNRRHIYELTIKPTGEMLTTPYKKRAPKVRIKASQLQRGKCPDCGFMLVSGVCMNKCKEKAASKAADSV